MDYSTPLTVPFAIIQDYYKENEPFEVSIKQILEIINADRNPNWQDYTEEDWYEGWQGFIEGHEYTLISEH